MHRPTIPTTEMRATRRRAPLVALAAALALAAAAAAQPIVWEDVPDLEIVVTSDAITVPEAIEAGYYRLVFDDRSGLDLSVSIARHEPGVTRDDLVAALAAFNDSDMGEPNGRAMARIDEIVSLVGGDGEPDVVVEFRPGEHTVVTVGGTEDGRTYIDTGLIATLTVGATAAMPEPPAPDVTVRMVDFAFALPPDMRAGEQTWEVVNVGAQIHNLILVRPAEGHTIEDLMAYLEDPEPAGPPPAEDVAVLNAFSAGESNFLRFDLTPGDYLVLCFMPDYETGQPHVALGMAQSFTVPAE